MRGRNRKNESIEFESPINRNVWEARAKCRATDADPNYRSLATRILASFKNEKRPTSRILFPFVGRAIATSVRWLYLCHVRKFLTHLFPPSHSISFSAETSRSHFYLPSFSWAWNQSLQPAKYLQVFQLITTFQAKLAKQQQQFLFGSKSWWLTQWTLTPKPVPNNSIEYASLEVETGDQQLLPK